MANPAEDGPIERAERGVRLMKISEYSAWGTGFILDATGLLFPQSFTLLEIMGNIVFAVALTLVILVDRHDKNIARLREQRRDEKEREYQSEINRLKSKAEYTTQIAVNYAIQNAPRRISGAAKELFKTSLSKYAGQKFEIIVEKNDEEAVGMATDIESSLKASGWVGSIWRVGISGAITAKPGITVGAKAIGDTDALARVVHDLTVALLADGIKFGVGWSKINPRLPVQDGFIEIDVGKRPIVQ